MADELDVLLDKVDDPVLAELRSFEGGKVTAVYESDAARPYT